MAQPKTKQNIEEMKGQYMLDVEEPQERCAKSKEPDTEVHVLYDSVSIKCAD